MTKIIFIALLICTPSISISQKVKPEIAGKLPKQINESSGLLTGNDEFIWTMNDGGGKNILFGIKKDEKKFFVSRIVNASNQDWEDIAGSPNSIFIGDFGNGANLRRNLGIYIIDTFSSGLIDFVRASTISFHYPDQNQFPPSPSNWNFDCEAFFHHGDSLYLFSKNLSNPDDGYTKMYRLPDQPGDYTAELIDSFYLNEPVTSADISSDGKTVVLLTYFSLWVFKDFPGNNFFEGKVFQFPFKGLTQKEAICFANDHGLFMTDERHFGKGGKLYKIDLKKLDFSKPTSKYKKQPFKRAVYNAFNNPKVKYKKIMKKEAAQ